MKSIKTNPNSAKGPDKENIVNKFYIILVSNLGVLVKMRNETEMKHSETQRNETKYEETKQNL